MNMKGIAAAVVSTIALTTLIAATTTDPAPSAQTCATIAGADVCTWVVTRGDRVTEIGVDVPLALIESVPADPPMVWPPQALASIPMPDEARTAFGIDHMEISWEAHGHPPATFMTPHFDFHFYNVGERAVAAIDCSDTSKPAARPAGYELPDVDVPDLGTLVGLCVPLMGMHAVPEGDVTATAPFDGSMLVGYYDARPIFFEPMVSKKLLLGRSSFTLPMPRVAGLPAGVRYPSTFRAEYDAASDKYRLVFGGFETQ